jgi:hypothetical protein
VGLIAFFWAHMVAGLGMRVWSNSSGATPIECMMRDTNGDEYVSCSAILHDQVVPLECGSSIFNIGCRINYGAAAPGGSTLAGSATIYSTLLRIVKWM